MSSAAELAELGQFEAVIRGLLESDNAARGHAEQAYRTACTEQVSCTVLALAALVRRPEVDVAVRRQCGILLRQCLLPTTIAPTGQGGAWEKLAAPDRATLRGTLLSVLAEEQSDRVLRRFTCNVISVLPIASFPELLPRLLSMAADASPLAREGALRIFKDGVVAEAGEELLKQQSKAIGGVLQAGLADGDPVVRSLAVQLLCKIVDEVPQNLAAPLQALLPAFLASLEALLAPPGAHEEQLQECLQAILDICEEEAAFFKPHLQGLLQLLLKAIQADWLEDGSRQLSLELLVSLIEARPKMCAKAVPGLSDTLLRVCAGLLTAGNEDDPAWPGRFEEEDENDESSTTLSACSRLAEAFGAEVFLPSAFQVVGQLVRQQGWAPRAAGLAMVGDLAESIEEEPMVDEALKLLLGYLGDPHPQVRDAALAAISQMSEEQNPYMQQKHHTTMLPRLCQAIEDTVPRVQVRAMQAMVDFADINELDAEHILPFLPGLMQGMSVRMEDPRRPLREMAITLVATAAGCVKEAFRPYYTVVLPVLHRAVQESSGKKQVWLRGKAVECISMIAVAVGKETFARDASVFVGASVQLLLATREGGELADDEGVLRSYAQDAIWNFASVLGRDIAPYAPAVLPDAVATISMKPQVVDLQEKERAKDWTLDLNADGRCEGLKTHQVEEIYRGLAMIRKVVEALGGTLFLPYFHDVAQALMPLLDFRLDDELRGQAAEALAEVLVSVRSGLDSCAGSPEAVAGLGQLTDLLQMFLNKAVSIIQAEPKPAQKARPLAAGLGSCLEAAVPGMLANEAVTSLSEAALALLEASFVRSSSSSQTGSAEDEEEEEEEKETAVEAEEELRRSLGPVLSGALMRAAPETFILQGCLARWDALAARLLLAPDPPKKKKKKKGSSDATSIIASGRQLALEILGRRFERLGDAGGIPPGWDHLGPRLVQSLGEKNHGVRLGACACVGRAAGTFILADPQTLTVVATALNEARGQKGKRRDQAAQAAQELATAASLALAVERGGAQGPAQVRTILELLPLNELYVEDSSWLLERLCHWTRQRSESLLGADMSNFPLVIGSITAMYERYGAQRDILIQKLFAELGQSALGQVQGSLSEKQRRILARICAESQRAV